MSADPLATDLDLVDQARDGSQEAVVELWVRHYPAALAAARRTSRQQRDAEELASDAFSNMLSAFASGGGPTGSVRAYLLTSVRNLAVTRSRRASSSEVLSDDVAVFEDGSRGPVDPMARQTEISMMRQAFAALPRRWQIILWRTAVDHDRNIEIGEDLGISPNAVAALAKRARRGLRQAYLQTHLSTNGLEPGCEPFVRRLPMLAIDGSVATDDLARHLSTCLTCPGRLAELQRVEQQLGSMLGPAVLLTAPGFLAHTLAGAAGASAAGASLASGGTGATAAAGGTGATAGGGTAAGTSTAAGGTAASGGTGATATSSSLVAKLTAGKVVATAMGAAAAVSAALLIPPDDPPPSPPSAQVIPTTTPPLASTDPPTPSPTETATPTTTREAPAPRTTSPPAKPSASDPSPAPSRPAATTPPSPSPTPTSSPSTTVATTPLRVGMGIFGPAGATSIQVHAQAQGTTGAVSLTVRVPSGVVLRSGSGDWRSCEQSSDLISCTARSASGRWGGTIVTGWPDDVSGRVTAEVGATYRSGGRVNASASVSWPP